MSNPAGSASPVEAWELFGSRADLEAEMTRLVNAQLKRQRAIETAS